MPPSEIWVSGAWELQRFASALMESLGLRILSTASRVSSHQRQWESCWHSPTDAGMPGTSFIINKREKPQLPAPLWQPERVQGWGTPLPCTQPASAAGGELATATGSSFILPLSYLSQVGYHRGEACREVLRQQLVADALEDGITRGGCAVRASTSSFIPLIHL